jgi:hypothetical protein
LVLTKQLLDFANKIISSVNSAKTDVFFGEDVKSTNTIYSSLDSKSEVCFDWLVIAKDNKHKDDIFYKVWNASN